MQFKSHLHVQFRCAILHYRQRAWPHDIHHNDARHNDIEPTNTAAILIVVMLSVMFGLLLY